MKSKLAARASQDETRPTAADAGRLAAHRGRQPERHSLAVILDAMRDGVYIANRQRRIEYANPAMQAEFGPINGHKCYRYLHDRSRPCPTCRMAEVLAGQTVHWEEYSVRTGKTYDFMATPLSNPDGTVSRLEVLRDISERKQMETTMARERDILHAIMENAGTMLAYLDRDFNFVRVNAAYAAGSGHTVEELVGRNHFALFPDAQNQAIFEKVRDSAEPVEFHDKPFEFRDQPSRGITYWDWTLTPAKDDAGSVQGLVLSLIETTERKQAELAEREHVGRLQRLLDSDIIGIIVAGLDGKINYANDAFLNIVGYSRKDLVSGGLDWTAMTPPEFKALDDESLEKLFANGSCPVIEKQFLRKDGERVPVLVGATLWDTSTDNPIWVCLVLDVTDLRHTQRKLQQSEASYRTLVESAPDGIMSLTVEGRIIACNEALCRLLGYDRKEVLDRNIRKFMRGATDAELKSYWDELIQNGLAEKEFEVTTRDGKRLPLWGKAVRFDDIGGNPPQAVVYVRDIAERRNLDHLKDELIGLMSHELRTPLTIIIGAVNTVLTEFARLSTEEIKELLNDAAHESEALAHILTNLLELSRAQAQRLSLATEPISIGRIAQTVSERIHRLSPSHQFLVDFPPGLPRVNADSLRLERVLYNLMENATKYSPPGTEIRVFANPQGPNMVVGVSDQGQGISLPDQAQLFEPFRRLDEARHGGVRGAGLGLLVCRRLVEAHGGRIWVESQPGHGSTFLFSLPLASMTDPQRPAAKQKPVEKA